MGGAAGVMQMWGGMYSWSEQQDAGREEQKLAEYNALVAEEEGRTALAESQFAQRRTVAEGERTKGAMIARMGASGARLDVGAPLRAIAEQSQEIDIDQLLIAYEGKKAAQRATSEARIIRKGGQMAHDRYSAAATSSLLQGLGMGSQTMGDYGRSYQASQPSQSRNSSGSFVTR